MLQSTQQSLLLPKAAGRAQLDQLLIYRTEMQDYNFINEDLTVGIILLFNFIFSTLLNECNMWATWKEIQSSSKESDTRKITVLLVFSVSQFQILPFPNTSLPAFWVEACCLYTALLQPSPQAGWKGCVWKGWSQGKADNLNPSWLKLKELAIGLAGCEEMREDQGTQLISSSRHFPKGEKLFHDENVRPWQHPEQILR